uniref:Uncharacterized protein n=1 Tax=Meloidogyne incognita TaxID=6306 RepID=A0A914LIN8_MELIC
MELTSKHKPSMVSYIFANIIVANTTIMLNILTTVPMKWNKRKTANNKPNNKNNKRRDYTRYTIVFSGVSNINNNQYNTTYANKKPLK